MTAGRRGIAIAAAVVALLVGVAVGWLWRPLGVPEASPTPTPTETPSIFEASEGTCVAEFDDAWQLEFDEVSCSQQHAAEMIGTVDVTDYVDAGTDWPGDDALADWAVLACEGLDDYPIDITELQVRWPLEEDWAAGERNYVCFSVTDEATATPSATPTQ